MISDFSNDVVVITGGGRGIGAAAAKAFCQRNAKVMIVSRSQNELMAVVESCKNEFGAEARIDSIAGDISDPRVRETIFVSVEKKWGTVSVLVNNAATISVEKIEDVTLESWQKTLDVNVTAGFHLSQIAFSGMKKDKIHGSIVNISSIGGISGTEKFPGFTAYTVSKFAVVGMTEAMAVEGRSIGVRVNCIAPGAVDTKMLRDAAPFLKTETSPDDIAKIILFLADPAQSGAMSGSTIPVHSNIPES